MPLCRRCKGENTIEEISFLHFLLKEINYYLGFFLNQTDFLLFYLKTPTFF